MPLKDCRIDSIFVVHATQARKSSARRFMPTGYQEHRRDIGNVSTGYQERFDGISGTLRRDIRNGGPSQQADFA
jgi:hypothetical protein